MTLNSSNVPALLFRLCCKESPRHGLYNPPPTEMGDIRAWIFRCRTWNPKCSDLMCCTHKSYQIIIVGFHVEFTTSLVPFLDNLMVLRVFGGPFSHPRNHHHHEDPPRECQRLQRSTLSTRDVESSARCQRPQGQRFPKRGCHLFAVAEGCTDKTGLVFPKQLCSISPIERSPSQMLPETPSMRRFSSLYNLPLPGGRRLWSCSFLF